MRQATPEAGPSTIEAAPSETVVDSELHADFTDDEVDPDQSVSEKTVMLSVAEGEYFIHPCSFSNH